jgi:hypothetical protein
VVFRLGRRIASRLIADPVARLITGPAAFLLAGFLDVVAFAGQSLRALLRRHG